MSYDAPETSRVQYVSGSLKHDGPAQTRSQSVSQRSVTDVSHTQIAQRSTGPRTTHTPIAIGNDVASTVAL